MWIRFLAALMLFFGCLVYADKESFPRARPLTARKFERTQARLARGKYLAEGLLQCFLCHSERDWSKPGAPPLANKKGAGAILHDDRDTFLASPNITPDPETGAGRWTDDMLARSIREGIGHDGRALHPLMWYRAFRNLSDEDTASIVVYLRSIPAVRKVTPPRRLTAQREEMLKHQVEPLTAPVPEPDHFNRIEYAKYLMRAADCVGCHTSWYSDVNPGFFAGGNLIERDGHKAFSSNLTPDPTGIPYYNPDLFIEVMRTGKLRGARELSSLMPWIAYKNLNDEDLKAIFAFLQSLAPLRHAIDNTTHPTMCKLCGQLHGQGDRNQAYEVKPVKINPALLNTYQGQYRFSDGQILTIKREDDHLVMDFVDSRSKLFPKSDTDFVGEKFAGITQFVRDKNGKVGYVRDFSPFEPGIKIK